MVFNSERVSSAMVSCSATVAKGWCPQGLCGIPDTHTVNMQDA